METLYKNPDATIEEAMSENPVIISHNWSNVWEQVQPTMETFLLSIGLGSILSREEYNSLERARKWMRERIYPIRDGSYLGETPQECFDNVLTEMYHYYVQNERSTSIEIFPLTYLINIAMYMTKKCWGQARPLDINTMLLRNCKINGDECDPPLTNLPGEWTADKLIRVMALHGVPGFVHNMLAVSKYGICDLFVGGGCTMKINKLLRRVRVYWQFSIMKTKPAVNTMIAKEMLERWTNTATGHYFATSGTVDEDTDDDEVRADVAASAAAPMETGGGLSEYHMERDKREHQVMLLEANWARSHVSFVPIEVNIVRGAGSDRHVPAFHRTFDIFRSILDTAAKRRDWLVNLINFTLAPLVDALMHERIQMPGAQGMIALGVAFRHVHFAIDHGRVLVDPPRSICLVLHGINVHMPNTIEMEENLTHVLDHKPIYGRGGFAILSIDELG